MKFPSNRNSNVSCLEEKEYSIVISSRHFPLFYSENLFLGETLTFVIKSINRIEILSGSESVRSSQNDVGSCYISCEKFVKMRAWTRLD